MNDKVFNFTLHAIGETVMPPGAIESKHQTASPIFEDILDIISENKNTTISFDDGYVSDVEIALPALLKRRLKAMFFITVNKLGLPGYLSRDGVCALSRHGMLIGSHGMNHADWRLLSSADLSKELTDSKNSIEKLINCPVNYAVCPFGGYNRNVLHGLKKAGYGHVFTSDRVPAKRNAWLQPRFSIVPYYYDKNVIGNILSCKTLIPNYIFRKLKIWIKTRI